MSKLRLVSDRILIDETELAYVGTSRRLPTFCDPRHIAANFPPFHDKPMTIEIAAFLECSRDQPTGHRQS